MATQTTTQSIAQAQADIVDEFALFDDWTDKYQYIIDVGREIAPLPDALKTDDYIVTGCQSRVWLVPEFDGGIVTFRANSDAFISGGLIALAVRAYSGHTPPEILSSPPDFIPRIGMEGNISLTRLNGLQSVINKMKWYAAQYAQGQN